MKKVLIVGRPNVGKSSLFNRLVRKRKALVLDQEGVTRDILKSPTHWWGYDFEVWDSGGFESKDSSFLSSEVKKRIQQAFKKADLVIFVMDAHQGLHEDDKKIFKMIKSKPFLPVVNKVDHHTLGEDAGIEFSALGRSCIQASFEQEMGVDQIVSWILNHSLKEKKLETPQQVSLLLTGKSNVGKSSLCNCILNQDRMVTSSTAHTTVDVVDEIFYYNQKRYKILDTAGLRKKSRRIGDLEKISSSKALSFFHEVDIILLVVDAQDGISRQDMRLLSYCITHERKACILVMNKWDLVKDQSKTDIRKNIRKNLGFFPNLPVVFTSAKTYQGVQSLLKKIEDISNKIQTHIPTSHLNRFLIQTTSSSPCPMHGTKNIKFYYLTQTKRHPPSFILFTNYPKGVRDSYKKFLIKKMQKKWSIEDIPIDLNFIQRR